MEHRRRVSWASYLPAFYGMLALLGLIWSHSAQAVASAESGTLFAARDGDSIKLYQLGRQGMHLAESVEMPTVPLGSVWKLFMYGYLVARGQSSPDYQCHGKIREEVYCCEAGGAVDREEALQRSCGLYFNPQRLGVQAADWKRFWQARAAPLWLSNLSTVREDTRVSVSDLLAALDAFPPDARQQTAQTLLGVLLKPNAGTAIESYGGMLRGKTWTMPDPRHKGMRIGGAAGWLANGHPFWMGGSGAGIEVLRKSAPAMEDYLAQLKVPDDAKCVEVRFFDRYPLAVVLRQPGREPAREGPLNGEYLAVFAKSNTLPFSANGELRLVRERGAWVVRGRLGLNEYVARVLDREASAEPVAAARALAITARTYLVQQAEQRSGCYVIRDSSATQRVAPRPASREAREVADWSSDLILRGMPVRYHADKEAPGVLSWQRARQQAEQGADFITILSQAFPAASLMGIDAQQESDCVLAIPAQRWLAANIPKWRTQLESEPGYNEPDTTPTVCLSNADKPFADTDLNRLHVRGWATQEDRIALAHEYLHVAFEGHPHAYDEAYIEKMARRLIMEMHP